MVASPNFRGQLSLPFVADIYVFAPLSLLAFRTPLLSDGRRLAVNTESAPGHVSLYVWYGVANC